MSDNREDEHYKVGYRKPPKSGQFRKGVSGNPSGRPKKAPDFDSLLVRELNSKMIINEDGKRKTISKAVAFMKLLVNKTLSLHGPTTRLMLPHYLRVLEKEAQANRQFINLNELTDAQLMWIATSGGTILPPDDSGAEGPA